VTDFLGYLGLSLILASGPVYLARRLGASSQKIAVCLLVCLCVWLIPWNGQSPVFYIRGVIGDISATTWALVLLFYGPMLLFPVKQYHPVRGSAGLMVLAMLIPLYASTLGYWHYDLYAWGYDPTWMLPATGLMMLWAWYAERRLALAWLCGVACFAMGWLPGRNLWDALFDPVLAIGSIWVVGEAAISELLRSTVPQPEHQAQPFTKAA